MPTPLAILQDWNLSVEAVKQIADQIGGRIVHGRGVDHAIIRDCELLRVHRLGKFGSDHPVIVVDVRTEHGDVVRLLLWNVWVGQDPAHVARTVAQLVDRWQPHLVGLVEAYRCRRVLKTIPGYRRLQGLNIGERADVAILARRSLRIVRRGPVEMARSWIGPKHGKRKRPRVARRVGVRLPSGRPFRLLVGHAPTGGYTGRNAAAVREHVARTIRWAGKP